MSKFVVLRIRDKAKVLKDWFGVTVRCDSTFADVYAEFSSGVLDGQSALPPVYQTVVAKVQVGKSATDQFTTVQPETKVGDATSILGVYIEFSVSQLGDDVENESLDTTKQNVFDLMMNVQRNRTNLPERVDETDRKKKVANLILDLLKSCDVGWSKDDVKVYGTQLINTVTNCMWYLDGHHETLAKQGCGVPAELSHLQGYNIPETHGHKRKHVNLEQLKIQEHSLAMLHLTQQSYMKQQAWSSLRTLTLRLATNLRKYANMLLEQNAKSQKVHSSKKLFSTSENSSIVIIEPKVSMKPTIIARYKRINEAVASSELYKPIYLNDYLPADKWKRSEYMKNVTLSARVIHFTHSSSKMNTHFVWKIPVESQETEMFDRSYKIRDELIHTMPVYHTRAMRAEFVQSFGRVTGVKSAILREAYKRLTGDNSAASYASEEMVDKRVKEMLDMEDPDLIWDLRMNNQGRPEQYTGFLEECKKYIEGAVQTAVDDRRHDEVQTEEDGSNVVVTHLATALSVRELHETVASRVPEGTAIPSEQWLRLQFWPRKTTSATSRYFTGKLKLLKFMVQARQFRKEHVDGHYASALFRYEKEFALQYRSHVDFVCMDDKHTCKVGEPGYPVAAVDRGKKVIVGKEQSVQVADHDFCKISITPSVTFILDLPDDIEGSFYRGQVYVGIKENCFQPSSPLRHTTELSSILQGRNEQKEVLCLYTDGGPDHRLTYLSVQLALICLFLRHYYDMVVAVRTPPNGSWKDPAERIMSILNIGLQAVGLMRAESPNRDIEAGLKKCNSMKDIRAYAEKDDGVREEVVESVRCVKDLLGNIFSKLCLKGKHFKIFEAAPESELHNLFSEIMKIDSSVNKDDTTIKKIKDKTELLAFMKSHCVQRNYMFSVKKCGATECNVCDLPRLPPDVFSKLNHLPDPIPDGEHFKRFEKLYGTSTSEEYMPSLKEKLAKGHGLEYSPSGQTAKNTKLTVQCIQCSKWRIIHSSKSLKPDIRTRVEKQLELLWYTCGSVFSDIESSDEEENALAMIGIRRNLNCMSPIEVPYYTAGHNSYLFSLWKRGWAEDRRRFFPTV